MANNLTIEQAREYVKDPRVKNLLGFIIKAEGGAPDILYGGKKFTGFSKHPGIYQTFIDSKGKKQKTSAAGLFQMIESTWNEAKNALGLKDFSPENQYLAAVYLLNKRGAIPDILNGNIKGAITKLKDEWASMPTSTANQPKKSWKFANDYFGYDVFNSQMPDLNQTGAYDATDQVKKLWEDSYAMARNLGQDPAITPQDKLKDAFNLHDRLAWTKNMMPAPNLWGEPSEQNQQQDQQQWYDNPVLNETLGKAKESLSNNAVNKFVNGGMAEDLPVPMDMPKPLMDGITGAVKKVAKSW